MQADGFDVVSHLKNQRNLLISQVDTYKILREQIKASPESDRVMVLIGDGYFVEKTVDDALQFLDRRIRSLSDVIDRFSLTIEGEGVRSDSDAKQEDKLNEEGLPFMDIVEELDEDGNIVGVTMNDEKVDTKLLEESTNNAKESPRETETTIKTPQDEAFMDIVEHLDEEGNVIDSKVTPHNDSNDPGSDEDDQVQELLEDMGLVGKKTESSQLLERIDKLDITDEEKSRVKNIVIERENAVPKIEEIDDEKPSDDEEDYKEEPVPDHIMIDRKDLLELEVLADAFNEEEDEAEMEDYQFDFDVDEDEEFDDDDDDDEYDNESDRFFGNDKANSMLWDQISKLRESKKQTDLEVLPTTDVKEVKMPEEKKKGAKKSVSFNDKLEVFEIDKIKKDMYEEPQSFSRFRQLKMRENETKRADKVVGDVVETVGDIVERPFGEVVERPVGDIIERPLGDVVETVAEPLETIDNVVESPVGDIIERPVGDIIERPVGDIIERPVGDIIERQPVQKPEILDPVSTKEDTVSDIIERTTNDTQNPVSDISETPIETVGQTIVENEFTNRVPVKDTLENPVSDIVEKSTDTASSSTKVPSMPRVSRFKQIKQQKADAAKEQKSRSNLVMSDVSEKPSQIIQSAPAPEDDLFRMIKDYEAENDEIEGPVINNLADIDRLNEMHDRIDVDSYEVPHDHDHEHQHEHEHAHQSVEQEENSDEEDFENIEIREHEFDSDHEDEVNEDVTEDLDTQIKQEYLRLQSKYKPQNKSTEFETPTKESRFRQRLHR